MTPLAVRPLPVRIRRRPPSRRHRRHLAINAELISVAGLVGSPVYDGAGNQVGALEDVVVRWDATATHPRLHGAIVRTHRHPSFVPTAEIAALTPVEARLTGSLERRPPHRQEALVALAHDVLDRQIVDTAGADVVRVSDLVLGRLSDGIRLVGVDVSTRTLLRRLGPRSMRQRVALTRVYDWALVAAFSVRGAGEAGSVLRLTPAAAELRKRRPADRAALLGDLPPDKASALSAAIQPEQ
jgi:sporulation protein YlmC with PRC-barrel domain